MAFVKKTVILIVIIFLISCAPSVDYNFNLDQSIKNNGNEMFYADSQIHISFNFLKSGTWSDVNWNKYYTYSGITFFLYNKTDKELVIDWNKVSIIDHLGSSGNAVMHNGVKYIDCSSVKQITTIPPLGKFDDIIIPCYGVDFKVRDYGSGWTAAFLPSPHIRPKIKFGIYFPLQIGSEQKTYSFTFCGERIEIK